MQSRILASLPLALLLFGRSGAAAAETLEQALVQAYETNPQILAERANLRAIDEGVPQAIGGSTTVSGWRPTVQFTGSAGSLRQENTPASTTAPPHQTLQPKTVDLNITQPLYQGGGTVANVAAAEENVESERANNLATETTVFLAVIQAYFDVLRDGAVVDLNANNEQVLRRQLEATNDQFRVGSVTRTDVAQAEARLAAATASRQQAEGTLQVSRSRYVQAVGHLPENLVQPQLRPVLPVTREEALALAATKNLTVIRDVFAEDAARSLVLVARSGLFPSVNLVGDVQRLQEQQLPDREQTNLSLTARVTMPLYEGGTTYSRTRQQEEKVAQALSTTDNDRRIALQGATQAWETIQSARASVTSLQATIRAAEIALEGTRQEATVGSRTVLDVLNAEQELFSDRVSLVQAQHDLAVAEFNLAGEVGQLTAIDLKLPVRLYDVDVHYKSVRNKWLGFGADDNGQAGK